MLVDETVLRVAPEHREHFREMLRQQYLGDQELLRDAVAGREDPEIRLDVSDRVQMVRQLAEIVGLPEREMGRRRDDDRPRARRWHLLTPRSNLWVTLAILLSTVAVYTILRVWAISIPALFIPIIFFVTLRHGRRMGLLLTVGYFAVWLPLVLMDHHGPHAVLRGVIGFTCVGVANWLVRRDLF